MPVVSKNRLQVMLKTRWRKKGERTLEEAAGIVGFNVWKIAQETYKHMEGDGFRFESDAHVTRVITEFLAYLVQATDRLVYAQLDASQRARFMNALAQHLATTLETNQLDFLGPGDYRKPFIDTLNARASDYAEYSFTEDGPSYPFLRYFAERVSEILTSSDNKWVVEHIMELEAPDMLKFLRKLITEVLDTKPV